MAQTDTPTEDLVNVDKAFNNAWLVYVNGVEMPVSSVSVSYGVWQIPEAEVTLIPDASLQRLGAEDRLSIQIFYLDHWHDPTKKDFRLMFDGEIVAWSYVNVQRGRSVSLTCHDYMQIFTQLFFFFMSNIDDIATGIAEQSAGVRIDGVTTAGMGTLYPYSLFADGLLNPGASTTAQQETASAPRTPLIKRPIEYVYNLVRSMIQVDVPNRSVPAANFFAPWSRRTKFHRRFLALPYLEDSENPGIFPILRAVQADFAISAVAQLAQNIGSEDSMWGILHEIYKTLMMEIMMLPTPPVVKSDYDTLDIKGPPDKDKSQALQPLMLGNYMTKPEFLFGIPPMCNVFFPPMVRHMSYREDYATQPTRTFVNGEAWMGLLDPNASIGPGEQALLRMRTAVAHPEELNFALKNTIARPGENAQNVLVYPEEFFKGPVVDRHQTPRWFSFLSFAQDQAAPQQPSNPREVVTGSETKDIYRKYAAYQYFKERFARRNGGLVLNFNPYVVPGFPCAVFDRRSTKVDVFGYVMSVRQTLSTRDATTQVSFSYGRTFSENFKILREQFELENKIIKERKNRPEPTPPAAEPTQSLPEDQPTQSIDPLQSNPPADTPPIVEDAELIGPIAMGPPEPLAEIRDRIQNFDRAEAFYKALFYRHQAPADVDISLSQVEGTLDQTPDTSGEAGAPNQGVPKTKPKTRNVKRSASAGVRDKDLPPEKKAAFHYADVIEYQDPHKKPQGVKIAGLDAKTRADLKAIVDRMRANQATAEEITKVGNILSVNVERFIELLPESVNQSLDVSVAVSNEITNQSGSSFDTLKNQLLNRFDKILNETLIQFNVNEFSTIVPKSSANALFESYDASMAFTSRPVCTLEEYIRWLGADGAPEGEVKALATIAPNDPRTFPAKYFRRIRQYRAGPPDIVPEGIENITNTGFITTIAGTASLELEGGTTNDTQDPQVRPVPDDFPENRENWDKIILAYNNDALERLSPKT